MNIKKDTVTECNYKGDYTNAHGTFHDFWVTFQNGDTGIYTGKSKDNPKFVVGQEAWYSLEPKQGRNGIFYKVKPESPPEQQSAPPSKPQANGRRPSTHPADVDTQITRQSSLKIALDLVNHGAFSADEILPVADYLSRWCMGEAEAVSMSALRASLHQSSDGMYQTDTPYQHEDHIEGQHKDRPF